MRPLVDAQDARHAHRAGSGSRVRSAGSPIAEPETLARSRHVARVARVCILIASDVVALSIAGTLAYLLWALPEKDQPVAMYLQLAPLLLLFVLGYAQAALYPGFGLGPVETLRRLSYVTAFGFLMLAAFSFALKAQLYSRVTFAIAISVSLVIVPLGRVLTSYIASRWRWWREPVTVIGTSVRAAVAIRNALADTCSVP